MIWRCVSLVVWGILGLIVAVQCQPEVVFGNTSLAPPCHGCGHNCDANCNCGICSPPGKCASKGLCMGACNAGGNAKWCGGGAPPAPTCHTCGHNCDDECNCGICSPPGKCATELLCLGACNAGGNARWCGATPTPVPTPPPITWSTADNKLQANGTDVVLHGIGTTCTEYLLRGIGMKCFVSYNWPNTSDLLHVNHTQLQPLIDILTNVTTPGVITAVRIPLTASSWLGVNTTASSANMARFPHLADNYQAFIQELVVAYTSNGIVVILDLHWSDDDSTSTPMAKRGAVDCVVFWASVARTFAGNDYVMFELYNEPHVSDIATWLHGDEASAGMVDMLAAVRASSPNPVIIAGAYQYAYDAASLLVLDAALQRGPPSSATNVIWNFHPYMGPPQAGASAKCPVGFEGMINMVLNSTERPVIITEFGQACCGTHTQCESCLSSSVGYDEEVMQIAALHSISWLPWAWRPMSSGPDTRKCEDVNGGLQPPGGSLAHPTDGKGADFLSLWNTYA